MREEWVDSDRLPDHTPSGFKDPRTVWPSIIILLVFVMLLLSAVYFGTMVLINQQQVHKPTTEHFQITNVGDCQLVMKPELMRCRVEATTDSGVRFTTTTNLVVNTHVKVGAILVRTCYSGNHKPCTTHIDEESE